jgi:hypothetical protein
LGRIEVLFEDLRDLDLPDAVKLAQGGRIDEVPLIEMVKETLTVRGPGLALVIAVELVDIDVQGLTEMVQKLVQRHGSSLEVF